MSFKIYFKTLKKCVCEREKESEREMHTEQNREIEKYGGGICIRMLVEVIKAVGVPWSWSYRCL